MPALNNTTSVSLLTTSSMAALNARLETPVTVEWLRHNFVVRTLTDEPYQEDGWTGLVRFVGSYSFRLYSKFFAHLDRLQS